MEQEHTRQRSHTHSQSSIPFTAGLLTKRRKGYKVRIIPESVKREQAVDELRQVKRSRVIGQKWNPSTIFSIMWGLNILGLCVYLVFNKSAVCRQWVLFIILRIVLLFPTITLAIMWRHGWWPSTAPDPEWIGVFFAIYISVIVTLKFCTESNVDCRGEFASGIQLPESIAIKLEDTSDLYNVTMVWKHGECNVQEFDGPRIIDGCRVEYFQDVRGEFEKNVYAWTGQLILYLFAFTSLFKPAFAATVVYNVLMVGVVFLGCALQGASFWTNTRAVDGSDFEQAVFVFLTAVVVNLYSAYVLHTMERELVNANYELSISMEKRQKAPTGQRVVYLETDLQSSTKLWDQYTDTMHKAIKIHHNLMRSLSLEYFGWEIATEGDAFLLAFHDVFDAVSMALTFQAEMMEQDWPAELLSDSDAGVEEMVNMESSAPGVKRGSLFGRFSSKSTPPPANISAMAHARKRGGSLFRNNSGTKGEGMIVFRGPRVRMAVHMGEGDFGSKGKTARFVHHMTDLALGGMILLSHPVAEKLFGVLEHLEHTAEEDDSKARLVSMGSHTFEECSEPMELFHIFSEALKPRHQRWGDIELKLRHSEQHSLGFYDAPVHREGVQEAATIVFGDISHAEGLRKYASDAFAEGLNVVQEVMKPLLFKFRGYQVPQREGHYMLVFHEPLDAARFHAALQVALMDAEWPDKLVDLPENLRPDYTAMARQSFNRGSSSSPMVIQDMPDFYRGMCVSFGMSIGYVNKQLEGGRANYLGPTCNRAARIAALARRGQLLMSESEYQADQQNLFVGADPIPAHAIYANIALKGITGSINIVWLDTCPLVKSRELQHHNKPIGTAL